MSAPKDSEPRESEGVLSNLPRTRPQRSSPRRAAARAATAAAAAANTAPARANGGPPNDRPAASPENAAAPVGGDQIAGGARRVAAAERVRKRPTTVRAGRAARPRGKPAAAPVPKQGFECDGERASGPVQPPGGTELVASAAEIIGELAKAGLSTGERLLKDVLSRLPLA
jgi:hypothetical protein